MELFALKDLSTSDPNLQEVEVYYLKEILQKGKFSTRLLKASSSESDGYVAIKLFPKSKAGHCNSGFLTEVKSVMNLSHPNLVKYHTFYKDALIKGKNENLCEYSALVMEYISQGDLFQLISKEPLSEKFARTLFRQMISVIEYLHEQSLTHLDIKLENFLVTEEGIKLIDFDGCQDLNSRTEVSFPAGTAGYRPPEFVKGGFQDLKSADIYSLGIVLFTMITGTPPYTEIEENNVYKFDKYYQTLRSDSPKFWKVHEHYRINDNKEAFSQDFKQLVEGMLAENPSERLSIEKIKRTKWFKGDSFSQQELSREIRNVY